MCASIATEQYGLLFDKSNRSANYNIGICILETYIFIRVSEFAL